MSSIIFEGNTYTFGATVSANPGTGTTSFIFGGLNFGQTYGFILRSFNNFGFSNFAGPIVKLTESIFEESREMIGAFAYSWGLTSAYPSIYYDSGSTLNMMLDSETMSSTWWGQPGLTRTPSGVTLPNGRNNGIIFTTPSGFNYYDIAQLPILQGGQTYVYSFYLNETLGSGGIDFLLYFVAGSNTPMRRQILPVTGSWTNSNAYSNMQRGVGLTGWVRYAFELVADFGTSDNNRGLYYVLSLRTPNIGGTRNYYIGSPLLEQMI
jgi:hypothetical protein